MTGWDDWTASERRARVLRVLREVSRDHAAGAARDRYITAQDVAHRLGVTGARRLGRGAVQGSWTGYMAPALRVAPALRSLVKADLVTALYDWRESRGPRYVYGHRADPTPQDTTDTNPKEHP